MKAAINPVFGDDGTFWMNFSDFSQHFRALNVCKVSDWEEIRVKGEFTTRISEFDNLARSRFYYEIKVAQKQRVLIGLH
jgi:calpain-15